MNIEQQFLTINEYSRPGIKLKAMKGIVIHWVANPNSSAIANRNFFESRKNGGKGYGSAHYIIGLEGEVIQCIPISEMSYHVGAKQYKPEVISKLGTYSNSCTLGIECTHIDWNGKMRPSTYNSLLKLCADLCTVYKLDPMNDLYLHYDITGKDCHKWFVENPDEWMNFKETVIKSIKTNPINWKKDIIKKAHKIGYLHDLERWVKDPDQPAPMWAVCSLLNELHKIKE